MYDFLLMLGILDREKFFRSFLDLNPDDELTWELTNEGYEVCVKRAGSPKLEYITCSLNI